MSKENEHQLIETYLRGKMEEKERLDFEERLSRDPGLQEKALLHKKADLIIRHRIRKEMKEKLRKIDLEFDQRPDIRRHLNIRRLVAAAAVVLLIAITGLLWIQYDYHPERLAERFYAETEQDLWRSAEGKEISDSPLQKLIEAENAFNQSNYAEAEKILLAIENSFFQEQKEWNLAMSYYPQQHRQNEFDSLLRSILQNEGHAYHNRAKEFVERTTGFLPSLRLQLQ